MSGQICRNILASKGLRKQANNWHRRCHCAESARRGVHAHARRVCVLLIFVTPRINAHDWRVERWSGKAFLDWDSSSSSRCQRSRSRQQHNLDAHEQLFERRLHPQHQHRRPHPLQSRKILRFPHLHLDQLRPRQRNRRPHPDLAQHLQFVALRPRPLLHRVLPTVQVPPVADNSIELEIALQSQHLR